MCDMRTKFEKLSEVEEGLRHCHYNESTGIYHADAAHVEEFEWHTQFVNGAWMLFQERQKKIYKVLSVIKMQEKYQDRQIDCLCDEIKDILK